MVLGKKKKKGSKPMSEEHRRILRTNRKHIVRDLHPKYIMDDLLAKGIITSEMKNNIMASAEKNSQVQTLLDMLETRGDEAFYILLDILKADYIHLAYMLDPDGSSCSSSTFEPRMDTPATPGQHCVSPTYRLPAPIENDEGGKTLSDENTYDPIYSDFSGLHRKYLNPEVDNEGGSRHEQGVILRDTIGHKLIHKCGRGEQSFSAEPPQNGIYIEFDKKCSNASYEGTGAKPKASHRFPSTSSCNEFPSLTRITDPDNNGGEGQGEGESYRRLEEIQLQGGTKVIVELPTGGMTENMLVVYDGEGCKLQVARNDVRIQCEETGQVGFHPRVCSFKNATFFLSGQPMGTFLWYNTINPTAYTYGRTELALVTSSGAVECWGINSFSDGSVGFNSKQTFGTIADLLDHHKKSREDLPISLRRALSSKEGMSYLMSLLPSDSILDQEELVFKQDSALRKPVSGAYSEASYRGNCVSVKTGATADRTLVGMEDTIEEVRIMSELSHDHILKCLGACLISENKIFVITENIGNGSLKTVLAEEEISDGVLIDITKQLLSAVSYLHSRYIIHRALFVGNIFVGGGMKIKLGEFGRAKKVVNISYKAEEHECVASHWCAPEVISNAQYSSKSDVWDLALTIIDIFNGGVRKRLPCKQKMAICSRVLHGSIPERPERCPKSIFRVLRQCLVDPARRLSVLKVQHQIETICSYLEERASSSEDENPVIEEQEVSVSPNVENNVKKPSNWKFWRQRKESKERKDTTVHTSLGTDNNPQAITRL